METGIKTAVMATMLTLGTVALVGDSFAGDHRVGGYGYQQPTKHKPAPPKKLERENMLLLLTGIRRSYECEVPVTDRGSTTASCHDHEVIDLKTNKIIGYATDATIDVDQVGDGLVGTGTTFFYLNEGTFVVRGRGSIQPVLYGDPIHNGSPATHIAGIFPDNGDDNILTSEGSGKFEGATGTFSLLGALDLTDAASGISAYYCVYIIDMEYPH